MIIDILFAIILLLAIFKGWSKGLLVGVFSLLALVLGTAAALKLSGSFAIYMEKQIGHPSPLWPVVAFVLIFLIVALLVRLLARILEKALKLAMLGWFNRLCGVLLYVITYVIIFSIGIWLANQLYLISPTLKTTSRIYDWVAPLGPRAISYTGDMIPWFKDIFNQLETFFQTLSPIPG